MASGRLLLASASVLRPILDIDRALNINVQLDDFKKIAQKMLSKELIVLVYCRSGRCSLDAAEILTELGHKVGNLKGGIMEWKKEGLPIMRNLKFIP